MTDDQIRRDFEAWYLWFTGPWDEITARSVMERNSLDHYAAIKVDGAWDGWQAAASKYGTKEASK